MDLKRTVLDVKKSFNVVTPPSLDNTFITIIIPVYNAEKYLKQALDSVLLQSFLDFEIIAINDASTDSSL